MEILESSFFSQLIYWTGFGSAPPRLEALGELFADPEFDERAVMHPLGDLGDEPMDVSAYPTVELPDTVLFPDQTLTLTVSRTDPLLRLVERGRRAAVRLADDPAATLVKFGPRFGQPREDDGVPGGVCTLGTVRAYARPGSGEATLSVLAYARVSDQGKYSRLRRNPAYEVFGACADFPELQGEFREADSPVPRDSTALGDAICWTSWKRWSRSGARTTRGLAHDWDDGGNETPERPVRFLDVAADFIAVSLIQRIPNLDVPVHLQREWLDMLDPCARVRALNAFAVEALDDMMTPDRIYRRALQATIKRYERVLMHRGDDPLKEDLRSEGDKFLQQKLKDARAQLTDPVARLRGKLDMCGMPREVRAHVQPEIDHLSATTDAKRMEYFRCLADLPWTGGKAETLDLERARRVLDERHFGLREAKERILEYLAVRRRKRDARGSVLCFAGPPGVGKSSLAASTAEALGRRFAEMSCNGMRQVSDVRGDPSLFAGAQPGRIIRQLQSVGARNPVFVLDEIDKIGDVAGVALLDALDPTRNAAFHDHYLDVPFDLSEVLFIATANVLGRIPTALRNRLEVIEIAGYSDADKLEIARRRLVPARILDHGLTSDLIVFEDGALRTMIRDHAQEMGVRALDRAVSAFCRRAALRLETPGDRTATRITVTEKMVGEVLGARTGHGEGLPDVERLRVVIELGDLPPQARRQGRRELELLSTSSPGDSDYNSRFDYLRWLTGVPWNARDETRIDLRRTRGLLDERHSGLATAKERILEYLAARKLGGGAKGSILCIIGPPGVGKTSLARSIADAMGRQLAAVSCGGLSDETELRGHNRTWKASQPGRIVRELVGIGVKNPVLVLDEIDKMERTAHSAGAPESALLEILDPAQNHSFADHYIEVPFDLSEVFFVATANVRDMIPVPLQDRLEVIELPGYSAEEKVRIAGSHLVGRQLADNGLTVAQVRFTNEALHALIRGYTREAGVRELERRIGAVCRKVALRRAEGDESPTEVTERTLADLLGAPQRVDAVVSERMGRPGVAMGLVWTPAGGEVLFVEARQMPGAGALTLTGHLGDVMKESAHAALSWVRARAARYGIDPGFYKTTDVHLHVPAGAVPKDGPSAGVTMAAALVSELTGRPVRSDLVMSGEITLSGNVLPVGGIKEKVLGARRVGVAQVILPKQNEREVNDDLGADLRREIGVHHVSMIDEALELALTAPAQREQRVGQRSRLTSVRSRSGASGCSGMRERSTVRGGAATLGVVRQVRRHAGLGQLVAHQLADRFPDLVEHGRGDPLDDALAVRLKDQPLFRGHEQLGDIDVEDPRETA